jgi:predicted transcriptional regulator of viral defense system
MSTYKRFEKIYSSSLKFFTIKDLRDLLGIENRRTFEEAVKKLESEKVLTKIERGKYLKTNSKYSKFEISQFIYNPSYISLETALSYYGLIEQLPFEITAITTKKSVEKEFEEQIYSYKNINKELLIGYRREEDFLIALPEKAIFDQLYLSLFGIKSENILKNIKKDSFESEKVLEYLKPFPAKTKKAFKNKFTEIFKC